MMDKARFALWSSAALPVVFVGSLYVRGSKKNRNHPTVIKQRFLGITGACILSPLPLIYMFRTYGSGPVDAGLLASSFGLSARNIGRAIVQPLLLTAGLYAGPLLVYVVEDVIPSPRMALASIRASNRLQSLRDYVVAPVAEEFVFRACSCGLLLAGGWSHMFAGIVAPFFFGLAHFHHLIGRVRSGDYTIKQAVIAGLVQMSYTTAFGAYAGFIYFRTGHLVAPIVSHTFCNIMGLPDVARAWNSRRWMIYMGVYLLGVSYFADKLYKITDPQQFEPFLWNWSGI